MQTLATNLYIELFYQSK